METKDEMKIGGFLFGSQKDAQLAKQEMDKISFLEKRLDYNHPEGVLKLYNKAIETRVFHTPVGYQYLLGLQEFLKEHGYGEQAESIPLYNIFSNNLREEMDQKTVKRRVQPSEYKQLRGYLRKSVILNLALGAVILLMFVISLTGKSPTILNYEKRLVNKYAGWEQELTERENAIREKERSMEAADS